MRHFNLLVQNSWLRLGLIISFIAFTSVRAAAYTECNASINRAYSGDGLYWMVTSTGQSAYFPITLPSAKYMTASIMLSEAMGRSITIRFAADGVSCNWTNVRSDVVGIWL